MSGLATGMAAAYDNHIIVWKHMFILWMFHVEHLGLVFVWFYQTPVPRGTFQVRKDK
jgi:hypothetical protein